MAGRARSPTEVFNDDSDDDLNETRGVLSELEKLTVTDVVLNFGNFRPEVKEMHTRVAKVESAVVEAKNEKEEVGTQTEVISILGKLGGHNMDHFHPKALLGCAHLVLLYLKDVISAKEAAEFLQRPQVRDHVDSKDLNVFGNDQGRPMWAQFVKTREARRRSSHASLLRRVCLGLVKDAAANKEAHNAMALEDGAFDVDWSSGTIWLGEWKIGSCVHRAPANEDVRVLSSGWVDVGVAARALGVAWDVAHGMFFSPQTHTRSTSRSLISWNLGGQSLTKADVVAGKFDLLCVQEAPRDVSGWREEHTDGFVWLLHQGDGQWRGCGIAVSHELFDSTTDRVSCSFGAAWVVRLKNTQRFVLASLHLPTGVNVTKYYQATTMVRKMLQGWHEELPCFVGVDVNTALVWNRAAEEEGEIGLQSGGKIDKFLEMIGCLRLRIQAPRLIDRWVPTHYPRDELRDGRHIDCILTRGLASSEVVVDPDVRLHINTDHALLRCTVELGRTRGGRWRDSRPRFVVDPDSVCAPQTWEDVKQMAKDVCKPRVVQRFSDDDETKDCIAEAKSYSGVVSKDLWKKVHAMRKQKKRDWREGRIAAILGGDWHAYRQHKQAQTKRNWWGRLLRECSARELGRDVVKHLEAKVREPNLHWDQVLDGRIDEVQCRDEQFVPIHEEEVWRALSTLRAGASLGPDQVGVDLLKKIMLVAPASLCRLFNDVLYDGRLPEEWGVSLLALLPKVQWPESVKDLRPIAMSSSSMKVLTKIVMGRTFYWLRDPCPWSASGHSRCCADLHGTFGRLRDMTREWRLGVVAVKLDLAEEGVPFELRYLLRLLAENDMMGCAPGGASVSIRANRGIRQGSPESAELFGLIVAAIVTKQKVSHKWVAPGPPLEDVPADVGCYQDDIFLWGENPYKIAKNISLLADALREVGLQLATEKTAIISSKYYKGVRHMMVDGRHVDMLPLGSSLRVLGLDFDLDAPAHQQAKEVMGRIWSAFHTHKTLLCGVGTRTEKQNMVRALVEGCWSWCAGALHWEVDDLQAMNSLQMPLLGDMDGSALWAPLRGNYDKCKCPAVIAAFLCLFDCHVFYLFDGCVFYLLDVRPRPRRPARLQMPSHSLNRILSKQQMLGTRVSLELRDGTIGVSGMGWLRKSVAKPAPHGVLTKLVGRGMDIVNPMGGLLVGSQATDSTGREVNHVPGNTHGKLIQEKDEGGTMTMVDGMMDVTHIQGSGRVMDGGDLMAICGSGMQRRLHPVGRHLKDIKIIVDVAMHGVKPPHLRRVVPPLRRRTMIGNKVGRPAVMNTEAPNDPRVRRDLRDPSAPTLDLEGDPRQDFGDMGCGTRAVEQSRKNGYIAADKDLYASREGVQHRDSEAARAARAHFATVLNLVQNPPRGVRRHAAAPPPWTAAQWEDWARWVVGNTMVVDWSNAGVPDLRDVYFDADDDGFMLQLFEGDNAHFLEGDQAHLMQLSEDEERVLHALRVPDHLRRGLRDMMRTLDRHQQEDEGAEYRWGLGRWLQSWTRGCQDIQQVVDMLALRSQRGGSVPYFPVVRTPRDQAMRARCVAWNRQWSHLIGQLLEWLVDEQMRGREQEDDMERVEAMSLEDVTTRGRSRSPPTVRSTSSSSSRPRMRRVPRITGSSSGDGRRAPAAATTPATGPVLPASDVGVGDEGGRAIPVDSDVVPADEGRGTVTVSAGAGHGVVATASEMEDVMLVQLLQPDEAQRLSARGVRREAIAALGHLIGELRRIGRREAPVDDVGSEDVEWCLRVVDLALTRSIATQNEIATILRRRFRGERCMLPDSDTRGGVVQLAHPFVVGAARAFLNGLHDELSVAWLDPDQLPEDLRVMPPHDLGEEEEEEEEAVAYGDHGQEGRLLRVPAPSDADRSAMEDAPLPDAAGVVVQGDSDGSLMATVAASSLRPPRVRSRSPRGVHVAGPAEHAEDAGEADVEHEDGSFMQVPPLNVNEGEELMDMWVYRRCRVELNEFLETLRRDTSEDCRDVAWTLRHYGWLHMWSTGWWQDCKPLDACCMDVL
ncbi:unnamed protein product, partial [Symbiodinium sp. CCMP2456]